MKTHLQFISSRIDPGADDLEPVTICQGNLRQWYEAIEEMYLSLKLLVNDCEEYAAWERPCYAIERARLILDKWK